MYSRASHPFLICSLAILAIALLPTQAALAEEPLPDGRVFEMVTPPNNQDANVYVPFGEEVPDSQGVEHVLSVSGCG